MRTRRSVLLLIDVEPDLRKTRGDPDGWRGTHAALRSLSALRERLEVATDTSVRFNWFLRADPQVQGSWGAAHWVADACPQLIETIERRRDHCGIHPHLWRWDPRRATWFNELSDPGWAAECLQTSIAAFQRLFGRVPEASRFGDRWLSQPAVELLQASGIRFDLTIEPGLPDEPVFDDPRATGRLPDYRAAPREPYRPSSGDFLVPLRGAASADALWMVPVTTTRPVWRLTRWPPWVVKASRPLNLALRSSYVWPHLRAQLETTTAVPLVVVVRTGDLGRPRFARNFRRTTRAMLAHPGLARCEFTDPPTAVARWQTSQ